MEPTLIVVTLTCLAVAAGLNFQRRWDGCHECTHCRREEEARAARQEDERHDYEHKGGGWRTGDPDRYRCKDETCPRNPKR